MSPEYDLTDPIEASPRIDASAPMRLALNDKEYLPMIVRKILAAVREDAAHRA